MRILEQGCNGNERKQSYFIQQQLAAARKQRRGRLNGKGERLSESMGEMGREFIQYSKGAFGGK